MSIRFLVFLFLAFVSFSKLHSQCQVRIHSSKKAICLGDSIDMKAFGGCGVAFLVDFNDSTLDGMLTNNSPYIGFGCTSASANSYHLWMGTQTGQNIAYTPSLNLSSGGFSVSFDMVYGEDGALGPCDGPSTAAESVYLQYSLDNGATWVNIQSWNPNGGHDPSLIAWKNYLVPLPLAANTANTRFRWTQLSSLPANTACWGIDNIKIQKYVATQFSWSTGYFGDHHPYVSPTNNFLYSVAAASGPLADTAYLPVTVYPRPVSTFTTSRPLCKNTFIDLIYNGPTDSTAKYHWVVTQANQLADTNKSVAKALWKKTGQYNVKLVVTNNHCASLPTSHELLIEPLLSFYISQSQGCVPLTVNFQGNVQPPDCQYLWDFKDGSTDTAVNPIHTYNFAGNYGLTLIAITDSGCTDTASFPTLTQVYPLPTPDFLWSPQIIPWSNPTASFINQTSGGATDFWNFGDYSSGSNYSTLANPDHEFTQKGLFDVTLTATSDKGCVDSITKTLRVADNIFEMPNIITPNGDGYNEYLKISNLESLKYCHLEIYNRWGDMIYQNQNYQNDWNADGVAEGVYYFYVNYESWFGIGEQKGMFHIMRNR